MSDVKCMKPFVILINWIDFLNHFCVVLMFSPFKSLTSPTKLDKVNTKERSRYPNSCYKQQGVRFFYHREPRLKKLNKGLFSLVNSRLRY